MARNFVIRIRVRFDFATRRVFEIFLRIDKGLFRFDFTIDFLNLVVTKTDMTEPIFNFLTKFFSIFIFPVPCQ